jgi:hypothetical protein
MYNSNGPPKGFNVTSDQSSYDMVTKDIIISSLAGSPSSGSASSNNTSYSFVLGTDNINQIYKAELVSAAVKFNTALNTNIVNQTLLVSIPQLNQNTFRVASTTPINGNATGTNSVQSQIFCQIPDNSTPVTPSGLTSNGIISLYIGARMFDTVQYYNPPINKVNHIDVSFFDPLSNNIVVNTSGASGTINSFYFTLRVYYFQKRNNTSSFSTSVFNYAGSGTIDSIFQPSYQN